MRVVFLDSIYPDIVAQAYAEKDGLAGRSRAEQTSVLLGYRFGCWDAWANACRGLGAEAEEWLLDIPPLGALPGFDGAVIVDRHMRGTVSEYEEMKQTARKLVGMVSSKAPSREVLKCFDFLVTPFPHYAEKYQKYGYDMRYLPLAFDERRLTAAAGVRDLPITFIGGLGINRHWGAGQHAIARVAERCEDTFQWWGYKGPDRLTDALKRTYQTEAWGDDYFSLLSRSRLSLNRHGEVHEHHTCNMRTYEIPGMGALLFTEASPNLADLFEPFVECVPYPNPERLMELVRYYEDCVDKAAEIAAAGHRRVMTDHLYKHRAGELLGWLDG